MQASLSSFYLSDTGVQGRRETWLPGAASAVHPGSRQTAAVSPENKFRDMAYYCNSSDELLCLYSGTGPFDGRPDPTKMTIGAHRASIDALCRVASPADSSGIQEQCLAAIIEACIACSQQEGLINGAKSISAFWTALSRAESLHVRSYLH